MIFGHERLEVYRAAIEYVGWAYRLCEGIKGQRNAKEQLLRASPAIPLNIAEGNGKATGGERRRDQAAAGDGGGSFRLGAPPRLNRSVRLVGRGVAYGEP
ncbi:four helix bundle protein [Candidatus Binatia bacterium]|nr:four helix bundle protein [Candidatus Binatia bacterium]